MEMNKIKIKEEYNPLYIITFENKEDYDEAYANYPHSYIKNLLKNICKKKRSIYINKAPNPEDIIWKNLEFDKEHKYFINKFKNFGICLIYVAVPLLFKYLGN